MHHPNQINSVDCYPRRYALRAPATDFCVHGGFAAVNRGADFVKHLVPSLRARTRCLTGHREPHSQTAFACTAHGAGQHRDWATTLDIQAVLYG